MTAVVNGLDDADAAPLPDAEYGPVADWATDLDHADPEYNRNAHAIWSGLRAGGCPVAHSDRYHGMWVPLTHELVSAVAYDTEHFTSRSVVVTRTPPDRLPDAPIGGAPPITSDPPFHHEARRILLPPFSPKRIAALEPAVRRLCRERLDATLGADGEHLDGAVDYAQHIPVAVIAAMLGLPAADEDLFRQFVHDTLESVNRPPAERVAALERLDDYIDAQIDARRERRGDDLISYLLDVEIPGPDGRPEPLTESHIGGAVELLLLAGIDTTWSAIGSSLWHLATHPADRQRLVAEPQLMPTAIEEFLRAYAPVTMARLVAKDHDFHGCPMKTADWVLLPFPAANRDPAAFDRAEEVVIDRVENRHAAFGLGIHRCVGSNLARLELRVAVEEFLARIPDFELAGAGDGTSGDETHGGGVVWSVGQIRGPRALPLRVLTGASREV